MSRKLSYSKRDFASLRQEQIDYLKNYYPDVFQDYSDASILSVFIDLNAGVTDNLHFHADRMLQETVLEFAQEKQSIFNIARTYGVKLPSYSSSIAVVQVSVTVPVFGDAEDKRYLPIMRSGTRFSGGGENFELLDDLDFNAPINAQGAYDRTKVPNYTNGKLSSYTITKKGLVVNGYSTIYTKKFTTQPEAFYKIILPENNVIGIDKVIVKAGTNYSKMPTYDEFNDPELKWYEVEALADSQVFEVDTNRGFDPKTGYYYGFYKEVQNRFIKEFTPEGYCILTFGGSTEDSNDILDDFIANASNISLTSFLNNKALGNTPRKNTTMYIQYRVGGGTQGNVGVNVINEVNDAKLVLNGPDAMKRKAVSDSITVTNITPAVGGSDLPSIEELKQMISYNFAAQNRAVTLDDYKAIVKKMPSKFGSPARVGVKQHQNKILVSLLSYDQAGKYSGLIPSVLMENVASYLSKYRMTNDYVEVQPAKVIDIAINAEIQVTSENATQITANAISIIQNVLNNLTGEMGKDIYVGDLKNAILAVSGVINVTKLDFINRVGGDYSEIEINQPYSNQVERIIDVSSGYLYADETEVLQVRYPARDINVKTQIMQRIYQS